MKKSILAICLLLMIQILIYSQTTEEQARAYWQSLSEQKRVDFLIWAIDTKNADPIITLPEYYYVITKDKLTVFSNPEYINIKVNTNDYDLFISPLEFDFRQEYKFPIAETGIALVLGFLIGLAVK